MPYEHFHNKFPEIALQETRSFSVNAPPKLTGGEFGLLEMYCDEPGCDCRRVMFDVVSQSLNVSVAYIGYGWEDELFYAKRWPFVDAEDIREIQGPSLNRISPQSEMAPELLALVKSVLQDEAYVERIKRHYTLFRKTIEKKPQRKRKRKIKKRRRR